MERDSVWEKLKKNFKDGAALSIEKIEEYSKIGKLKIEEFAAKKKIERCCIDIGERVFDLMENGKPSEVLGDMLVKKSIDSIRELNEELASIDRRIKAVSEESKKSRGVDSTATDA
jgi:hypothetical protein